MTNESDEMCKLPIILHGLLKQTELHPFDFYRYLSFRVRFGFLKQSQTEIGEEKLTKLSFHKKEWIIGNGILAPEKKLQFRERKTH